MHSSSKSEREIPVWHPNTHTRMHARQTGGADLCLQELHRCASPFWAMTSRRLSQQRMLWALKHTYHACRQGKPVNCSSGIIQMKLIKV